MNGKIFKIIWIVLVGVSAFTLGYTLKPATGKRGMPPAMMQQFMGGMSQGAMAPGIRFPPR